MNSLRIVGVLAACLTLSSFGFSAQGSQTLPAGFEILEGNGSTSFPFNTTSKQIWQWHYDSAQFQASQPILITQIYLRTKSTSPTTHFNFPKVEVLLASSATSYEVAHHVPTFAANLNPDATVVHAEGPWTGNNILPLSWISMELEQPFLYDPSRGDDFIVQIRKCLSITQFAASIDGQSGPPLSVGGNRYGHTSECQALVQSFNNNEFVPIIRIDWTQANGPRMKVETLVAGQTGNISISGVDAGGRVFLRSSLAGAGPIPTGFGRLELSPPILRAPVVNANSSGDFVFSETVPLGFFGRTIYFHTLAEVQGALTFSNPAQASVQ